MRRKLRLALLVTLATLGGACAIATVATSSRWFVYGHYGPPQQFLMWWRIIYGRLDLELYELTESAEWHGWFDVGEDARYTAPDLTRLAAITTVSLTLDRSGSGPWLTAELPLWLPALAFSLWPVIVAVKARRRRRQQGRGFDVTPAAG